ncbi:DnaJ-class molecular chaperone [Desulfosalsimonas propionicica]|uniref:DnaJ-class molecular chaperone n=1 Tax=Desulfosalsimonas propionicica TaxID=332175 RepID=A0A7W0HLT1_9BACT|nr:DnaJ domain-containing protein [Desulfosalsimonas propionicica]MBA2882647.1 DnaJ-class molecular chaperone [Desulfosalsimonas propionicica]
MARSYYAILGIPADASHEEVKTAYRRLAKQYHPDHAGGDSRKFRDVQEAYSVLADSAKRREYERHRETGEVRVRTASSQRSGPARFDAEPLIPERGSQHARNPGKVRMYGTFQPAGDDLFEWILRNFF